MFRFIIRDMLWLTVVVAMAVGWWLNHRSLSNKLYRVAGAYNDVLGERNNGYMLANELLNHMDTVDPEFRKLNVTPEFQKELDRLSRPAEREDALNRP